jgi:hypothetical protein
MTGTTPRCSQCLRPIVSGSPFAVGNTGEIYHSQCVLPPYPLIGPTQDAYDAACAALHHWRSEARRLAKLAGVEPRQMTDTEH